MAVATKTSALATGLSASSTTTPASGAGGVSPKRSSIPPAGLNGWPNCFQAGASPGFFASRNPIARDTWNAKAPLVPVVI